MPKTPSPMGAFALRVVCPHINSANGFCAWSEYLRVPAVVIFALHPAKSFDSTGVCPSCVISVKIVSRGQLDRILFLFRVVERDNDGPPRGLLSFPQLFTILSEI